MSDMRTRITKNERGAALIETAITLPIILLISVAIFEFGRAYQTWQVLTNATREGARVAVIFGTTRTQIEDAVLTYAEIGGVGSCESSPPKQQCLSRGHITVNQNVTLGNRTGSQITINYPFQFMVLNPIARLVSGTSTTGTPLTMNAVSIMRNEGS
jgi:Flp pilus assembly protein TadG